MTIVLILFPIGVVCLAFANLMWMRTIMKWQKRQDEEIIRIYDHLKKLVGNR